MPLLFHAAFSFTVNKLACGRRSLSIQTVAQLVILFHHGVRLGGVSVKKLTIWDFFVAAFLAGIALNGGATVIVLCIIAFFLWLLVRPRKVAPPPPVQPAFHEVETPLKPDLSNKNEFLLPNGEIALDVDIDYHESKNHFHVHGHSPDWSVSVSTEYEYRVEGTDVFVRILHTYSDQCGDMNAWKIRDGVVLETELRDRGFDDDDIAELKQDTEWKNLAATQWDGFKYFLLSKSLPIPDGRRYFRGEIERLKTGIAAFKKLGVEPDIEPLKKCGLSWKEFHSVDKIVAELKALLGEEL